MDQATDGEPRRPQTLLRADVHLNELADSVFTELDDSTVDVSNGYPMIVDSWITPVGDEAGDQSQFFVVPGEDATCEDATDEIDMDYSDPAHLRLVA